MKMIVFALALLSLSVPVQAQTATATATWVQLNTLPDAQSFKYSLKDGTATSVPLTGVTCATVTGVTQCSATVPLPSSGPHSFVLIASSPDGALSAASPVLLGIMPGAPNGFKITITVTLATGG